MWRVPFLRGCALFLAAAALFLIANRGAYQGYFSADDLDNLAWTREAGPLDYAAGLTDPRFSALNFRPTGHFLFHFLGRTAGLDFRWYTALIHALHLLNLLLLWRLLRALAFPLWPAAAGVAFFAFHAAALDAYWKPMFLFDILCAVFLLSALLLYLRGRWLWALVPFWLAYKSKELAVALPAILLFYELWLGERRWRRVIPFALIALSFTLQALAAKSGAADDYSLRFTWQAFRDCAAFYSSRLVALPFAGLLLIPLALLVKDWRLRFGALAVPLLIGPLFFVPARLYAVYLYLPLAAMAIVVAALAHRFRPAWVCLPLALWLAFQYVQLRPYRRDVLAEAGEVRDYVTAAGIAAARHPEAELVVFDGAPPSLARWGVEGALRWQFRLPPVSLLPAGSPETPERLRSPASVAVLSWLRPPGRLAVTARSPGDPLDSYIRMDRRAPLWQLTSGWFELDGAVRWTAPLAGATLRCPPGRTSFELAALVPAGQLAQTGPLSVDVLLAGASLGVRNITASGPVRFVWPLQPAEQETTAVELRVTPAFRPGGGDTRELGLAVTAFGCPAEHQPR